MRLKDEIEVEHVEKLMTACVDKEVVKKCFEESLEAAYEILRMQHLYYNEDEIDVWKFIKKYGYCDELFLQCIFPLALEIFRQ